MAHILLAASIMLAALSIILLVDWVHGLRDDRKYKDK